MKKSKNLASIAIGISFVFIVRSSPAAVTTDALSNQAQKLITLDAPGWSLKRICAAISTQLGQTVEPHGDCVTDYLIVHVHNVPWPELMKKLAWVEYGKWYKSDGVLTIERDPAKVKARILQNEDSLVKRITAQFQKDKEQTGPFDAASFAKKFKAKLEEDMRTSMDPANPHHDDPIWTLDLPIIQLKDQLPLSRGTRTIIESLPPRELATVLPHQRVVYSSKPTSLQLPLPPAATNAINQTLNDEAKFAKALSAEGVPISSPKYPQFKFPELSPGFSQSIDDDTYSVAISNDGIGIVATLRVFGPNGKMLFEDGIRLGDRPNESFPIKPPIGTPAIPIPGDLKATMRNLFVGPGSPPNPSSEFLTKLRHPEKYDPLGFVMAPICNLAYPTQNQVIRCDLLAAYMPIYLTSFQVQDIFTDYLNAGYFRYLSDDESSPDWFLLRGNLDNGPTVVKLNREAYSTLVQSIEPSGAAPLLGLVRYFAAHPTGMEDSTMLGTGGILSLTNQGTAAGIDQTGWLLFQFVGSLNEGEIRQATTPSGLSIQQLEPGSAGILRDLLFLDFGDNFMAYPGQAPNSGQGYSILDEPTYFFAKVWPRMILHLKLHDDSVIRYQFKGNSGQGLPGLQEANIEQFAQLETGNSPMQIDPKNLTHFTLCPQKSLEARISFPDYSLKPISESLQSLAQGDQVYLDWKDFPEPVKSQIEEAIKKIQSESQN